MNVFTQKTDNASFLKHSRWDIGFFGASLDDRCDAAIEFAKTNCDVTFSFVYNSDEFSFKLNENEDIGIDDLQKLSALFAGKRILLEATSLGFVEMLCLNKTIKLNDINTISYLYIEPKLYTRAQKSSLLQRRDFELSDEVPGYQSIPGYSYMLSDEKVQKLVFFLGYEAARLDRAFEDYQMIQSKYCSVIFGVPAFQAGWEIDSFANNVSVIIDRGIPSGSIHYCGASNPLTAYLKLEDIYKSINPNEELFISPIGTTPEGIGAILFVLTHDKIGLLYDNPIKSKKRTGDIECFHLYDIEF